MYNVCKKVTHISELIEKQSKLQLRGQIITIFAVLRHGFSIQSYCLRQNYHHCSRILTRAGLPASAFLLLRGGICPWYAVWHGDCCYKSANFKVENGNYLLSRLIYSSNNFSPGQDEYIGGKGGSHYLSTSTQRKEWKWPISILFWHTTLKNSLIFSALHRHGIISSSFNYPL